MTRPLAIISPDPRRHKTIAASFPVLMASTDTSAPKAITPIETVPILIPLT